MKEANMLAAQLERCELQEKENANSELRLEKIPEFEALSPIRFLHAEKASPRNPRRETFNVNNSPLKALLPTVGPETCSASSPPKASKGRSPVPAIVDLPISKGIQFKSNTSSADGQLSKKPRPSNSPKILTMTTSSSNKKVQWQEQNLQRFQSQTATGNSRKDKTASLSLPCAIKDQEYLLDLRSSRRTNRRGPLKKSGNASGQACSAEDPQWRLRDLPSRGPIPVAQVKGKLGSRLCPLQTGPVKKSPVALEEAVPLQKANARQAKTVRGDGPRLPSSSKLQSSSLQIRTRSTAPSVHASRLPVPNSIPKATSRIATLGRQAVPGKISQQKPLNVGVPGGKGSTVPTSAGKKASAFQSTIPSGASQNSRLQLPKKATSGSSR
ncbi:proline/serine-rich coiled-coil protein 1 isoform X2 [Hemicordylus capensis]|nr:proline/serine-rich coiled-coil protein 1 isoform X2 [Hemicordylus capensis]